MNGGICGMGFAKLIPPQGATKYPQIVILNPQIVRIITHPDDCSLHVAYLIEYPVTGNLQKRQIIARIDPDHDDILSGNYEIQDTWTITNYNRRDYTGSWSGVGEKEEWPYPFPPIFCCKNLPNPNECWGMNDLSLDIIQLNNILNAKDCDLSNILYYFAHPKIWSKGITPDQMQMSIGDILCCQSLDAQLNILEMKSDLSSSLSYMSSLRSAMNERSRVPAIALGTDVPTGDISGIALNLFFQPLISKTIQKRRLYGKMIRELSRAALVMAGQIPVEEYERYKISLHWQDLLPVDGLKEAQTALLEKQLSVSDTTLLQRLGFDPKEEAEKRQQEEAQQMIAYSQGKGLPPDQQQQMMAQNQMQHDNQPMIDQKEGQY